MLLLGCVIFDEYSAGPFSLCNASIRWASWIKILILFYCLFPFEIISAILWLEKALSELHKEMAFFVSYSKPAFLFIFMTGYKLTQVE